MCGSLFYCQLTVDLPPQARLALPGRGLFAMTWRGECRRLAVETRGDVGHLRFPMSPLDTPLTFREPRLPAVARLNGGYGGSVPCVGQLLGRITAPNLLCVNRSAVSARPDSAGRERRRCEKLRFDQGCTLGAPNVPVGPSHLDARPKGVASRRKVRGVKRGQETIGVLSPFAPAGGHRRLRRQTAAFPPVNTGSPGPPKAATFHAMSWRTSLVPGGPISPAAASRRNGGKFRACLR